jgi:nicotinamidase-related amidase
MSKNVLVMIDVQREYNTVGRSFYINGIEKSLKNAKEVLDFARMQEWNIIHIKHLQDGSIFSINSEFSDYIDGFAPRKSETEFIKSNYSCFSNENFSNELEKYKSSKIFIAGYNSTMCVLSTIIEGYHRGYDMNFIHDASDAKADEKNTEQQRHEIMTSVLASFAKVLSFNDIKNEKLEQIS